jgi:adenylate kinase family enzyme
MHAVADETYFARSRIIFNLVKFFFRPVWVRRGEIKSGTDPLVEFKKQLDKGESLIIFPEGTRGTPGKIIHFKSGIGRLASLYPSVPIIPVFLKGPEKVLPKASSLPLPFRSDIIIGIPQHSSGEYRDTTNQLENSLRELDAITINFRRHHRKILRYQSKVSVGFLGIDGSGKSTVSCIVAQDLSDIAGTCLISDKVELFEKQELKHLQPFGTEIIRENLSRYVKKAKSLKLYKIPKLAELLLRNQMHHEFRRWYSNNLIILDGSPLLNLLAWSTLYRTDEIERDTLCRIVDILTGKDHQANSQDPVFREYVELKVLWMLKLNRLILPEIVVLIDVDPAVAVERIVSRGEQIQAHETEEKLRRLRDSYINVLRIINKMCGVHTIVIDGKKPLVEVVKESEEFVRNKLKIVQNNER